MRRNLDVLANIVVPGYRAAAIVGKERGLYSLPAHGAHAILQNFHYSSSFDPKFYIRCLLTNKLLDEALTQTEAFVMARSGG